MVAVRAEEEESSSKAAATAAAEEPVAAEALLRRKKGSKAASKAAGGGGMGGDSKKAGPTVIAPLRDQIYNDEPLTEEQKAEGAVVSTLAILFVVILAEGIFLAGSGFMSEGADQFAQDIVFPAFSPTLGLFLLISSAYGVWKTRGNEESQKKN